MSQRNNLWREKKCSKILRGHAKRTSYLCSLLKFHINDMTHSLFAPLWFPVSLSKFVGIVMSNGLALMPKKIRQLRINIKWNFIRNFFYTFIHLSSVYVFVYIFSLWFSPMFTIHNINTLCLLVTISISFLVVQNS